MMKRYWYNGRAVTPCYRGRRMRGRHLYAYRHERHKANPVNSEDLLYEISGQGVLLCAAEKNRHEPVPLGPAVSGTWEKTPVRSNQSG